MRSLWHSTVASLDDSLALFGESLGKLKVAKSVDISEVTEQLKTAREAARNLRALVLSELPGASWQNREELDALLEKIQKRLEARALEQLRSRLLALATELERGSIVHRRALRVNQLNQLRGQAINELRSQAESEGAPPTLPGPEADQWITWACGLKDPEDGGSIQTLRNGFTDLDDFVVNLEPNMWIAARSPTLEPLPKPERYTDEKHQKQSHLETDELEEDVVSSGPTPIESEAAESSEGRDEPQFLDEPPQGAFESNTLTPNDVAPPLTEEEIEGILARERAKLARMMGLASDPRGHFSHPVEHNNEDSKGKVDSGEPLAKARASAGIRRNRRPAGPRDRAS
jgi:hypothetical protein